MQLKLIYLIGRWSQYNDIVLWIMEQSVSLQAPAWQTPACGQRGISVHITHHKRENYIKTTLLLSQRNNSDGADTVYYKIIQWSQSGPLNRKLALIWYWNDIPLGLVNHANTLKIYSCYCGEHSVCLHCGNVIMNSRVMLLGNGLCHNYL
jgi:hypothetical protein